MRRRTFHAAIALWMGLVLLSGCMARVERSVVAAPPVSLIAVPPPEVLADDLDLDSLITAIDTSIRYYRKTDGRETYCFRSRCFQGREMVSSLLRFREIMKGTGSMAEKSARVGEAFEFYQAAGNDGAGTVLFTGYFEPVLNGSLIRTESCRYPLYRTPEETVSVRLGAFNRKYGKDRLVGRLKGGEVIPHFTRKEIDSDRSLAGRGLEIAWVDDAVALFILHIQGSGQIRLPDGRVLRVNYAQSNGKPFRGLTNHMVEKGYLAADEKSYQNMKAFLLEHPELRDDILNYNESYVFFRIVDEGPIGSLGLPVVAERSIATDPDSFPKGALAFIKVRKPLFDREGRIQKWVPTSRFVFSHDAGGAIKGPGRVDLFCGTGVAAERLAGSLTEKGSMFFLAPRRP